MLTRTLVKQKLHQQCSVAVRICLTLQRKKRINKFHLWKIGKRIENKRKQVTTCWDFFSPHDTIYLSGSCRVCYQNLKTSAAGWLLPFSVDLTPEGHLPLCFAEGWYWLWQSRCENERRRPCYSQRGRAVLPQPLTTPTEMAEESFSHSTVLRSPINHFCRFLSKDFTYLLFQNT